MKRVMTLVLTIAAAFAAGAIFVNHQQAARFARERATLQDAWDAEKAELEAGLEREDAYKFFVPQRARWERIKHQKQGGGL